MTETVLDTVTLWCVYQDTGAPELREVVFTEDKDSYTAPGRIERERFTLRGQLIYAAPWITGQPWTVEQFSSGYFWTRSEVSARQFLAVAMFFFAAGKRWTRLRIDRNLDAILRETD